MDEQQVEKRFDWIDDERRKDKAETKQVLDKIGDVEKLLKTQNEQIKEITSEVSRLAALTTRIHQMDETLSKHRIEVSNQLEIAEERRTAKEQQNEELRKTDQRSVATNIDDIRTELRKLTQIEETLENRREEEIRISKALGKLELNVEKLTNKTNDFGRSVAGFEDGRAQDNRRVMEVEHELEDLRKGMDRTRGDLESVDDRARRNEIRNAELAASEKERLDAQHAWIENQGMKLVEFDKEWQVWEKRFNSIEELAADFDERLKIYEDTYRSLLKMKTELDRVIEKLERRITEVSEMHRLAEDRNKQEWSSFQADDMKRWNTFKLSSDEQWREHDRRHEKLQVDLEELSSDSTRLIQDYETLRETDRIRLSELVSTMREWLAEIERAKS
jgi:chromosome segregation ATPase